MSYSKTTWVTGDIVTADKMNNIESGIQSVESKVDNIPSSSMNYDLELKVTTGSTFSTWKNGSNLENDVVVVSGSIEACEQKALTGRAPAIKLTFNQVTNNAVSTQMVFNFSTMDVPYRGILLTSIYQHGTTTYIADIVITYTSSYDIDFIVAHTTQAGTWQ